MALIATNTSLYLDPKKFSNVKFGVRKDVDAAPPSSDYLAVVEREHILFSNTKI